MATERLGLQADFYFKTDAYSDSELRVVRFEGTEALSQLFHFRLELAMDEAEADFDALLGKPGLLRIEGLEATRYISGIVSRFEQSSEPTRLTHYVAELVPKIWLLGLRQKSRIFQELSTPDIIKKVLTDAEIPSDEFRISVAESYEPRDYCVQYRESDLAFISRLMEEEGIFYFFEHSEDKHVLVLGDKSKVFQPIEGNATVIFHEATGEEPVKELIYDYKYSELVRPGEVVLRDYAFKKPQLDLTSTKPADKFKQLQVYDYPGEYTAPKLGQRLTEVRLQELQTIRKLGRGLTNCRRFVPGYKFTLDQHQRLNFNQEYLLTQVRHSASQIQTFKEAAGAGGLIPDYKASFSCIPSTQVFRPERVTPRPVIYGSQTAVVTGPAGEEIHVDEHGRIKVHFHWDREGKLDEKSSCWIRVSQTNTHAS
ncbi:MAG: type VI secretion system tip protein VgrG, partial [Acidobacteria bacterium]